VVLNETWQQLALPDGRQLEVVTAGPDDGLALLFQSGTPTAAVVFPPQVEAAAAHGLRTILYSRPGYAGSTPKPGRAVADCAADIAALLDALGHQRFVTAGWSGGGPHALACAALLPDRCAAAATIAGVAPYPAEGLDFLAGMAEENVVEFSHAIQGAEYLKPSLEKLAPHFEDVQGATVAAALGGLVSEVDKASLTDDFGEYAAAGFRRALSKGIEGWLEDSMAFVRPWGFDLAEIRRPVTVWQGAQDKMVPYAHGEWLAAHITGAQARLFPEHGHLSLAVGSIDRILAELVASAS
jgi:pimeloyl-ACP methyl ester carboxylesterase